MVPLYQRKYQWADRRRVPFWEDVEAKAREVLEDESKFQHYMGALILSPVGPAAQIDALVEERKRLPADWQHRTRMRAKRGHDEQDIDLSGDAGTAFRLIFRQNRINDLDFPSFWRFLFRSRTRCSGCAGTTAGVTNTPTRSRTRRSTTFTFISPPSVIRSWGRGKTHMRGRRIDTALFATHGTACSRMPTSAFSLEARANSSILWGEMRDDRRIH